jgi:hypothetical protein
MDHALSDVFPFDDCYTHVLINALLARYREIIPRKLPPTKLGNTHVIFGWVTIMAPPEMPTHRQERSEMTAAIPQFSVSICRIRHVADGS